MTVAYEYLCFAACIEIAASRVGFNGLDQIAIANLIGVTVSSESEASQLRELGVSKLHIDANPHNWGIDADPHQFVAAFERAGIPLAIRFQPISRFQDWEFEEALAELARAQRFPIVGFDYTALFGRQVRGEQGHSCVVFEVVENVTLYDPGPRNAGLVSVTAFDLYRACRRKPGGLWLVERHDVT